MGDRRSLIWSHFKKDSTTKRAQCMHCDQVISLEKSSYSNLKRHLLRKHPYLENRITSRGPPACSAIWKHFTKEPGMKAKCAYCHVKIVYKYTTYSLRRHMYNKHREILLEDESLMQGKAAHLANSYSKPMKVLMTWSDTEDEMQTDHQQFELQPIDNTELIKPITIENVHRKLMAPNLDVNEDSINHTDEEGMMHYEQIHSTDNVHGQMDELGQVIEETIVDSTDYAHAIDMGIINTKGSCNFLSIGMKDMNMKTATYATSVALELENLGTRQKIIAEKLISDALFNAKLEKLTEYSMVVVKVGGFENDCK